MQQYTGQTSANSNIMTPLPINIIASQLGSLIDQIKGKPLPYPVENNYSIKRKYFYVLASLNKCYYLDIEFPYFLQYKKKKFNWKGFMNEFGSADLSLYIQMSNRN